MRSKVERKRGKAAEVILVAAGGACCGVAVDQAALFDDLPGELADGGGELDAEEAGEDFVEGLHEGVELGGGGAEELVAELLGDGGEALLGVGEFVGGGVLERLELAGEEGLVAGEDVEEGLRCEAHRLLLSGGAADALGELALEEEAGEALGALDDLARDRVREATLGEDAPQLGLEGRDELDFDLAAVERRRGARGGGAARGRGLHRLELGDDLRGHRVELGARLELGLVVDDAGLQLLVAQLERDVGEGDLRPGRHDAVVGGDGRRGRGRSGGGASPGGKGWRGRSGRFVVQGWVEHDRPRAGAFQRCGGRARGAAEAKR